MNLVVYIDCALKPCVLYDKFKAQARRSINKSTVHPCDLKTNAELAAMHGITKRQVAKRRIPRTNDLRDK